MWYHTTLSTHDVCMCAPGCKEKINIMHLIQCLICLSLLSNQIFIYGMAVLHLWMVNDGTTVEDP